MKLAGWIALASLARCDPLTTTVATRPVTPPTTAASAEPTAVDAHIEFEEGLDSSYGAGVTTVRAILAVPSQSIRRQLFAVPFPYRCGRKTDRDLAVECTGDDGNAFATLRSDAGKIIVTARDYGRLDRDLVTIDLAMPPNATANIYAPTKFPTSFVEK